MAESFDPYFKWLAIPPDEQPPNHYRLLGVPLFTDDADVIETAADKQMMLLRSFATGNRSEHSQRLLNEVSAARVTLLDAERKAAYDGELKANQTPTQSAAKPISVADKTQPTSTDRRK